MRALDDLPWIYGAALQAAADEDAAGAVTERVMRDADPGAPRRALVDEAVRLAVGGATAAAPSTASPRATGRRSRSCDWPG
jgi:hypothetical protein